MTDMTVRRAAAWLAAASAALALSACNEAAQAPSGAPAMPPSAVSFVEAAPETLRIESELPGRIAPTRVAEVRPRVSGIVVERVFEQGGTVSEGDVLFRIDAEPFKVRVDGARAALQRAEATLSLANSDAERQARLKERGVNSLQQFDTAVAGEAQARADVASARASLAAAELDLAYADVRAPISGRIGRAIVTEGALVSSTGADSLATIQRLDPVYADFTQSANDLAALRRAAGGSGTGAEVRLAFDDGTEYATAGRFLFSEAAVDETTGQVTLRAEFPNPNGELLPGMYVRVRVVQGERKDAIAVPERAVQRDAGGKAQVYVVGEGSKAELRTVRLGRSVSGRRIVEDGLKSGDKVVVEGFQKIGPGAPVDAKPFAAAPAEHAAR